MRKLGGYKEYELSKSRGKCNEFMFGNSVNGIYCNTLKEMSTRTVKNMEWNVYLHDFNKNKIIIYNIFRHRKFNEEVQKIIKSKTDKIEFKDKLKNELMYWFWSKCEYEIVIAPLVSKNVEEAEIKIDIYDQVMLNFDKFVDYCWSFKEEK